MRVASRVVIGRAKLAWRQPRWACLVVPWRATRCRAHRIPLCQACLSSAELELPCRVICKNLRYVACRRPDGLLFHVPLSRAEGAIVLLQFQPWYHVTGLGIANLILLMLDRHECFQFFITCKRTNNANNTTHYVKLGKKRRESSKHNYYIITPRVITKAIIIMTQLQKNSEAHKISVYRAHTVGLLCNFYDYKVTIYYSFAFIVSDSSCQEEILSCHARHAAYTGTRSDRVKSLVQG